MLDLVAVREGGTVADALAIALQTARHAERLGFTRDLHTQARSAIADFLACAVIGGPDTVLKGLTQLQLATEADEFMLVSDVFDPALRLRSLSIAAQCAGLNEQTL